MADLSKDIAVNASNNASNNASGNTSHPAAVKTSKLQELAQGFYYNSEELFKVSPSIRELEKSSFDFYHSFGFQSSKRYNLHLADESTLISAIGNALMIFNFKKMELKYVLGLREGSIGAITIHPSKKYIAVGEINNSSPNIYIYEYPSFKLYRILRDGAEAGYSDLSFNHNGDKLASVGIDPDYMLTVWNWKNEVVLLRSKAFSQDIYRVSFSPENDGILTTSGMGHIKFWKISSTFTGLKLQGVIGKFGASELSDIAAFVQFPDGKVLSSTETGNLLLWEGGMIKCEISIKGKKPCHQGRIEVVTIFDSEIITAGDDGFIRIWDFETIDNADVNSDGSKDASTSSVQPRIFEIDPIDEMFLGEGVKIINMIKNGDVENEYIAQDQCGHLFKIDIQKQTSQELFAFHNGSVVGIDTSHFMHSTISLGTDGSIRLYENMSKRLIYKTSFSAGGSYISYIPENLDCKGSTFVAGFSDGTVRIMSHPYVDQGSQDGTFVLQEVLKPHKSAVTCIAFSADGAVMATASDDNTIFFFRIKAQKSQNGNMENCINFSNQTVSIIPIGFITLHDSIRSIIFSPDNHSKLADLERTGKFSVSNPPAENRNGKFILILLTNGEIYSALSPGDDSCDNSMTYELPLSLIKLQKWAIDLTLTSTQMALELEKKTEASKEENDKQPAEEVISKEMQLNVNPQSKIVSVLYLQGGYIISAFENDYGEGELRICKHSAPEVSRLIFIYKSPFSSLSISKSGRFLLMGAVDGAIILRKFDIKDCLLNNWKTGHQTLAQAQKDFDDQTSKIAQIIKMDFGALPEAQVQERIRNNSEFKGQYWIGHSHDCKNGKITSFKSSFDDSILVSSGEDGNIFLWNMTTEPTKPNMVIDDSNFEILEKSSPINDLTDSAAYSIQEMTLNYLQELRNEFVKVQFDYEKYANQKKITKQPFQIDPNLVDDIEKETSEKIENVKKEMAWISAKETLATEKLKRKFLDPVTTERVEIFAFEHDYSVSTFRTSVLESFDRAVTANDNQRNNLMTGNYDKEGRKEALTSDRKPIQNQKKHIKAAPVGNKIETRKNLRAERLHQYKELLQGKPDELYEDPKDVASIRYAQNNMGDYKLKTADKYIVPENERVDAEKKRRQINLLSESVHLLKEQFNHQVMSLRDYKRKMIESINDRNAKIMGINKQLQIFTDGQDVASRKFEMRKSAYPEDRYNVSTEDILKFEKENNSNAAAGKGGEDMMSFGNGMAAPPKEVVSDKPVQVQDSVPAIYKEEEGTSKSSLEITESEILRRTLGFQKKMTMNSISNDISHFDNIVAKLSEEKLLLAADLKLAKIRSMVLFKEWFLLKEFEKFENTLQEKFTGKQNEKQEIVEKILECQEKAHLKKMEIEQVILREKEIQEEFIKVLGSGNKNESYLTKVFKKKIKRSKKKVKTDDSHNGEEEESEEESDMDDYDSNASGDEDSYEEKCPVDCDSNLWLKVLELRELKLDEEDKIVEIQKLVDGLKKENDSFIKKEKIIDSGLKNAENDIQEFQTQKQRKLNELDVVVPLRFNQIQNLVNNSQPSDSQNSLVFTNEGIIKLKMRIKELHQERINVKVSHKELKKMHVTLNKNKKEKQEKIQELSAKAMDVQLLKFGKQVDLERLERLGVNRSADELREKIHQADLKRSKEIARYESKILKLKEALTNEIKQNTMRLESLADLSESRKKLEFSLNHIQSTVNAEYSGPQKKDVLEKDRLLSLVQTQSNEIEDLKHEIELLIRKPIRQTMNPPKNAKMGKIESVKMVDVKIISSDIDVPSAAEAVQPPAAEELKEEVAS